MSQGTPSQAAEKPASSEDMSQGTTSPAAKKLASSEDMSQGTTLVVPLSRFVLLTRAGFSRLGMTDRAIPTAHLKVRPFEAAATPERGC
jgi:hypothetical protein